MKPPYGITQPPSVLFVNAFDALAGSQRVGAMVVQVLQRAGADVQVELGFGNRGFLTALPSVRPLLPIENICWRKLLYPFWLMVANLVALLAVIQGRAVWTNSVFALPAALTVVLVKPSRLIVHVHELMMPRILHWMVRLAGKRGATVVTVSRHHANRLELPSTILWNAVGETPPAPPHHRQELVFVGDWRGFKGLDLFVAIARQKLPWKPVAVLGGTVNDYPVKLLSDAKEAGIICKFGLSNPGDMFGAAALALQLSDSLLVDETFSLTAAEAIWHLVPVASAGSKAVAEVAGPGLAFSIDSRCPSEFAQKISALERNPDYHRQLVERCREHRSALSVERFQEEALALLLQLGSRTAR